MSETPSYMRSTYTSMNKDRGGAREIDPSSLQPVRVRLPEVTQPQFIGREPWFQRKQPSRVGLEFDDTKGSQKGHSEITRQYRHETEVTVTRTVVTVTFLRVFTNIPLTPVCSRTL